MTTGAFRDVTTRPVQVTTDHVVLEGSLALPDDAIGVVLFAHGSGSSRRSPRNRAVAAALQQAGLATLLFDLLTPAEEAIDVRSGSFRFDIAFLADRLVGATRWIVQQPDTHRLRVGYFGASTGGAAALLAAAELPHEVSAVVSRGGRPDLAGSALRLVRAPSLLIVGGRDRPVLQLNERALAALQCEKVLAVVPGATHLFEEPGALEEVARLARDWFVRHLTGAGVRPPPRDDGQGHGP